MKQILRKAVAVGASVLLAGMSVGMAAAANYPNPFLDGSVAIVRGTGAGVSAIDEASALKVNVDLSARGGTTTTTAGSVTGEAAELYTGGTKLYVNNSLNAVKTVLTKSDLPTVLAKSSFSGNADATITQTINIGSNPRISFEKQPTSSDEPAYGLKLSTTTSNYAYNATATFSKAVNFSHADSEGEEIDLFGTKYTVGSDTDRTDLVLLQSAEKVSLSSDAPSTEVTVGGESYTLELVSASDTAATVKVTDSTGASESKEISESDSKKVNGIQVAVTTADETNLKLSASIVAGTDKITLKDGSTVKVGDSATSVRGTLVEFTSTGELTESITQIDVAVTAGISNEDAVRAGEALVDPVFGTFKLDFAGFNIAEDSATARETISIDPVGDDRMEVTFTDYDGNTATIQFSNNNTVKGLVTGLVRDDAGHNITVREMQTFHFGDYVVVGNEDEGHLVELTSISNDSTSATDTDYDVVFTDVFSGETYSATMGTSDATGTVVIGGKSYTMTYDGDSGIDAEDYNVTLNYPDSTAANMILYPTIQTSKGAKVMFYEPILALNTSKWDGGTTGFNGSISIPDGDGYTNTAIVHGAGNISVGGTNLSCYDTSGTNSTSIAIGVLNFNFSSTGKADTVNIYLEKESGGNINEPGLVIFEEKDDQTVYEALIVFTDSDYDGNSKGIGINDIERTWSNDSTGWEHNMVSDTKLEKSADYWGTIITTDSSDSDQKSATISYPDDQIYAQLYIAEESASITAGQTGSTTATVGSVVYKDTEKTSWEGENVIIIGGSCINSAAAEALGFAGATCTDDFTAATGVGSGQFLIQSVGDAFTEGKIALVVAGYNVDDTVNAATYLTTQTVDTAAGMKYIGTTSSSAELQVE